MSPERLSIIANQAVLLFERPAVSILTFISIIKFNNMKRIFLLCSSLLMACSMFAQQKSLSELQQGFVDYRFGMFIHYNMPT